jgi:hypothetical protein
MRAALLRRTTVRIHDLARDGCLLESDVLLDVGTIGLLDVDIDGRRCQEWFRICRVHAIRGRGGVALLGAEFLALPRAPRAASLRAVANQVHPSRGREGMAAVAGRSSGDTGNTRSRLAGPEPPLPLD